MEDDAGTSARPDIGRRWTKSEARGARTGGKERRREGHMPRDGLHGDEKDKPSPEDCLTQGLVH